MRNGWSRAQRSASSSMLARRRSTPLLRARLLFLQHRPRGLDDDSSIHPVGGLSPRLDESGREGGRLQPQAGDRLGAFDVARQSEGRSVSVSRSQAARLGPSRTSVKVWLFSQQHSCTEMELHRVPLSTPTPAGDTEGLIGKHFVSGNTPGTPSRMYKVTSVGFLFAETDDYSQRTSFPGRRSVAVVWVARGRSSVRSRTSTSRALASTASRFASIPNAPVPSNGSNARVEVRGPASDAGGWR